MFDHEKQLLEEHGLQVLSMLGQGGFGRVYQVHNKKFGVIAAKIMKEDDFEFGEWQTGIRLTKNVLNPFVLKQIESFQTEDYAVILMEYANMGGLDSLITSKKDIPIPLIRVIMRQIFEGLRLMHEKGLIHRDIKEQNILIHNPLGSDRVIFKICDFGLVKSQKNVEQSTLISVAGTLPYLPPELLLGNEEGDPIKADTKIDVWAAGIILHRLLTHTFPFKSTSLQAINIFMLRQNLVRPQSVKDDIIWDLITKLLTFDRKDRISSSDALNHPFFTGEQAMKQISPLSIELAQTAQQAKQRGDKNMTQYDTEASFSLHINDIKQQINIDSSNTESARQRWRRSKGSEPKSVIIPSKTAEIPQKESLSPKPPQLKIQQIKVIKKEVEQPKSIWIKIRDDLLKPIIGNESKKQEIIKDQEQGCDYIIQRFKGKQDEEGRREAIKDGLIEGLNYAFQNHELNSISRKYSDAFFYLTYTSDQIKLLIYQRQPYQGLLRLLEHTESLIVGDAIGYILNIINSGADTTSIKQQHPHFTSIQQYDGIRKIFELFNKNKRQSFKDKASICIGHLFRSQEIADSLMRVEIIKHLIFLLSSSDQWTQEQSKLALNYLSRNTVNRSEILKYVDLKKIEQDLKQPVKRNEQQKQSILQQQEFDIFLLSAVIQVRKDDGHRLQIFSSGIVDEILTIFNTQELNSNDEVGLQIYSMPPYPGLIRLLEHSNIQYTFLIPSHAQIALKCRCGSVSGVVLDPYRRILFIEIVIRIIHSILNILLVGANTTPETQQHPHFNSMQACDGIKKTYSLFHQNRNKEIKDIAAICIGQLFRAQEITNKSMRKDIIGYLKELTTDSDQWTRNEANWRLRGLAQNAVNKADIEADGFAIPEWGKKG
ncbi:MAG: putative aurora-B kinase Ark1 [Streblomastix strix]|uniref:Putative aurora-B kinase Ark1 n=1 Tax=Streblomastix strix TaxID=222440 RepID=A0A5J4VNA3_9EUKA|nr:MAG: putative aurora-B kinase Ark1 [Streblomastix strix]